MTDDLVAAVADYLEKKAPEIAELLRKDLTAGDVHQPTALGNQDSKKKKKLTFAEALAEDDAPGEDVSKADDLVDWTLPVRIVKSEPEQQIVYGWASVATKDGKLVIDKQGDIIMPDDLEKAAHGFVLDHRAQGDMHMADELGNPIRKGRLVASMVFTKQIQDVLKIDLGMEGWLVGFKVDDEGLWKSIKSGEKPEFSIGGRGKRVAA